MLIPTVVCFDEKFADAKLNEAEMCSFLPPAHGTIFAIINFTVFFYHKSHFLEW